MPHESDSEARQALKRLRRTADLYQATVRPSLLSDDPDARRRFDNHKRLQDELLDALGEAARVLGDDR